MSSSFLLPALGLPDPALHLLAVFVVGREPARLPAPHGGPVDPKAARQLGLGPPAELA